MGAITGLRVSTGQPSDLSDYWFSFAEAQARRRMFGF